MFKETTQPVWLNGREKEVNLQAGFICSFDRDSGKDYTLKMTGSALVRVFLNGEFFHYGPARGPHGYVRIDELTLPNDKLKDQNVLAFEVAGYNCNTFYTLNVPSFLQAELWIDDKLVKSTGQDGDFGVVELSTKSQKVMRYSYQRAFTEIYSLDNSEPLTNWTSGEELDLVEPSLCAPGVQYLDREVPIPLFEQKNAAVLVEEGILEEKQREAGFEYMTSRFIGLIRDDITGFKVEDQPERPFEVYQDVDFVPKNQCNTELDESYSTTIAAGKYSLYDMGLNNNGFITLEATVEEDCELYMLFDEALYDGKMNLDTPDTGVEVINLIKYNLKKSDVPYQLESFESYGYKFIKCFVTSGKATIKRPGIREYSYPKYQNTLFKSSDEKLNAVFDAAVETYRQNTLDCFMDCPTRERAGWLCDSYFTGQSALFFSGESLVEKVMLENYVLRDQDPVLPKGMLAMCYPAEHACEEFIPQWSMWYVLELEGYLKRSVEATPETFETLLYDLYNYFQQFKNSDGLLERLDNWNFIEWSDANEYAMDVNYPTNMLYCKMVRLMAEWFDDVKLAAEAKALRATIIEQAFDGTMFRDNSVRNENGELELTDNISEVCQYYAFCFGIADKDDAKYAELKDMVLNLFGPERKEKNIRPEIVFANSLMGNYLRMELLLEWGCNNQLLDENAGYYYKMAEITGTLWEHASIAGSLNHGFASYAGVVLIGALGGIRSINMKTKEVVVDFSAETDIELEMSIGTPYGDITVSRKNNGTSSQDIDYSIPKEFKVVER